MLTKNEIVKRMLRQAVWLGATQIFEFHSCNREKTPDFLYSQPGFDPKKRSVCILCEIPEFCQDKLLALCSSLTSFLAFGSSLVFSLDYVTPELPVLLGEQNLFLYEEENGIYLAVKR